MLPQARVSVVVSLWQTVQDACARTGVVVVTEKIAVVSPRMRSPADARERCVQYFEPAEKGGFMDVLVIKGLQRAALSQR